MYGPILDHTCRKVPFAKTGLFEILLTAGNIQIVSDTLYFRLALLSYFLQRLDHEVDAAKHRIVLQTASLE